MIVGLRGDQTQYVEKFSLKYSYDNVVWHNYTYKGHEVSYHKASYRRASFL